MYCVFERAVAQGDFGDEPVTHFSHLGVGVRSGIGIRQGEGIGCIAAESRCWGRAIAGSNCLDVENWVRGFGRILKAVDIYIRG